MQKESTTTPGDPGRPRRAEAFDAHPSVVAARARAPRPPPGSLSVAELRAIALAAGADDVSAVPLDHPDLAEERPYALAAMPTARSFVALVLRTRTRESAIAPGAS